MSPEVTFGIAWQWRSETLKGAALKLLQHPRLPFGRSFMQLAGKMAERAITAVGWDSVFCHCGANKGCLNGHFDQKIEENETIHLDHHRSSE
jgi:hypothetical protein